MAQCTPIPTATLYATITSTSLSLSTSFSHSVSTATPSTSALSTFTTCLDSVSGSSCSTESTVTVFTTIPGATTTIDVPVTTIDVDVFKTVLVPIATLYTTSCDTPKPTPPAKSNINTNTGSSTMMIFATNSSWELPDGSYSTSTVYVTTIIQPPNSDSDSSSSSSHKSNSAAVIGGATAGGIVALLAVTGILYWFWRKRKNWDDIFEEEEDEYTTDGGPPSHRPMSQVGTVAVQEPTAYQYGLVGRSRSRSQSPPLTRSRDGSSISGTTTAPLISPLSSPTSTTFSHQRPPPSSYPTNSSFAPSDYNARMLAEQYGASGFNPYGPGFGGQPNYGVITPYPAPTFDGRRSMEYPSPPQNATLFPPLMLPRNSSTASGSSNASHSSTQTSPTPTRPISLPPPLPQGVIVHSDGGRILSAPGNESSIGRPTSAPVAPVGFGASIEATLAAPTPSSQSQSQATSNRTSSDEKGDDDAPDRPPPAYSPH